MPGGETGDGMAAPFAIQVGLVQVRAQKREHCPVAIGEIRSARAEKEQPDGPAGPDGQPRRIGQEQLERVLHPLRPVNVGVHGGAVPLPRRVEVRDLYDAAQVPGAVGITERLAVPVVLPVRRFQVLRRAAV